MTIRLPQTAILSVTVLIGCQGNRESSGPVPEIPDPLERVSDVQVKEVLDQPRVRLDERVQISDAIGIVTIEACDGRVARLRAIRWLRGEGPTALRTTTPYCDKGDWWINKDVLVFMRKTADDRLAPLPRDDLAWQFYVNDAVMAEFVPRVESLASYFDTSDRTARRETLRAWLDSADSHLRRIAIAQVSDPAWGDQFKPDLLERLSSPATAMELGYVDNALRAMASRQANAEDLWDEIVTGYIAAAQRALNAPTNDHAKAGLLALQRMRLLHAEIADEALDYDGSPLDQNKLSFLCDRYGGDGECEKRWFAQHGHRAVSFWQNWYASGRHRRTPEAGAN